MEATLDCTLKVSSWDTEEVGEVRTPTKLC